MIFIKKWHCWIPKKSKIILCESQLHFHITWSTIIKWLNFAFSKWPLFVLLQVPTLKYYIFWSGNVTEILKKLIKMWSLAKKTQFSRFFLNYQKKLPDKLSVNYQKLVHNIYIIFDGNILFPIMKQMQVACQFLNFQLHNKTEDFLG